MKRRGSGSADIADEVVSLYVKRAWSGRFVDWCRRLNVDPLEVLRESARRKRGVS